MLNVWIFNKDSWGRNEIFIFLEKSTDYLNIKFVWSTISIANFFIWFAKRSSLFLLITRKIPFNSFYILLFLLCVRTRYELQSLRTHLILILICKTVKTKISKRELALGIYKDLIHTLMCMNWVNYGVWELIKSNEVLLIHSKNYSYPFLKKNKYIYITNK